MKKLFILSFIILITLKAYGQFVDIKQLVKERGIDINQIHHQDLLGYGIGNCDMELIKLGIANGADINYKEEISGQFPLCRAIYWAADVTLPDEESFIASLIRDSGPDVFSGRSVSDLRRDYIEIIRFLLQKGAMVNVSSDLGSTNIPLVYAAGYRDIEIINLLLDFKADPNSKSGVDALHALVNHAEEYLYYYPYKNSLEITKLLISKGAKVTPDLIKIAKENLDVFQSDIFSDRRAYPYFNEFINSLKSLIEFYSKL